MQIKKCWKQEAARIVWLKIFQWYLVQILIFSGMSAVESWFLRNGSVSWAFGIRYWQVCSVFGGYLEVLSYLSPAVLSKSVHYYEVCATHYVGCWEALL